ncbi:MAG: hypothetical protein HYZ28_19995 [Myxococcales bacterium]|nr:hypothetical protein [Myxococcales bacterium]
MKFEGGAWRYISPEELTDLRAALRQVPNGPGSRDAGDFYSAVMRYSIIDQVNAAANDSTDKSRGWVPG